MIVRAVLVSVVVAVVPGISRVLVTVLVLVPVLVSVGMLVSVSVLRFSVPMFMLMGVNMFMRMQMLVFVVALHCKLLPFDVDVS